jgi:hypothetical protein
LCRSVHGLLPVMPTWHTEFGLARRRHLAASRI